MILLSRPRCTAVLLQLQESNPRLRRSSIFSQPNAPNIERRQCPTASANAARVIIRLLLPMWYSVERQVLQLRVTLFPHTYVSGCGNDFGSCGISTNNEELPVKPKALARSTALYT